MKNKKRYKFNTGIQRIEMDTPDYSEAYAFKQQKLAKEKAGENIGVAVANTAVPGLGSGMQAASTLTDAMFKDSKGNYKNKTSELLSNQLNPLGKAGKAFSALTGDKSAAADLWSGSLVGTGLGALGVKNPFGKTSQEEGKEIQDRIERENMLSNNAKRFSIGSTTDAQTAIAKKGKYKVKSKEPRPVEWEGGTNPDGTERKNGSEAVFGPKMKNGKRKLLFYDPKAPTHEAGGVPGLVVPKEMYNNGTSNLMPRRSKVSLLGSGKMAVGAKQLKVKELNDTALSSNLTGMPAVNTANKFIQPMADIQQVARNIPEYRRKEKKNTPRSHKTVNPDTNRIIDPPMLYEMKPPPPRSTFNTKNDFNKGSKYVKTYAEGTSSLEIKKFAPGGDKVKAKATPQEIQAVKRIQRNLGVKDDGIWGPITQKAWERKNNITPKPDSSFTREDEREARKIFNADFLRAEQERKADSTLYANRIVPTALKAAKTNKKVYVTEKRTGRPDTGRKTGNNACLTGVCNVNKMTGTNLPFDMRIAANPNIKGDNPLETRFNPAFQKNSEKLGYKRLTANDKLQPGDVLQKSVAGIADHAKLFLGNKKGPLIGEDHGNDDDLGFEVEDFNYLNKYNKVSDAMVGNPGLTVYRYVGLPKRKASMELARTQVKNNKEAIARKKVEQQQKQSLASTEIAPSPDELEFMRNGSKYIKVYKDGAKSVSLAFSRGEKDPKGGLTQKGVDKYNRATGGNLKMAVTTPPSKLKPGSKAANRRKSFCARMSGVKGPMAKNGKPTRKALALRKWNC